MWSDKKPAQNSTSPVLEKAVVSQNPSVKSVNNVWTEELKDIITKQCLENGKRTAEEYPELVNDYCKCATQQISLALTPDDYTRIMELPYEEQGAEIRPIVQTCVDIMTKLIQLSQEAKPDIKTPQ